MWNLHKIIIVVFCIWVFLYPQEVYSKAGKTSAAFLKIGVGPRALAMGGAFCAIADDVSAMYWNPAGLSQLEKREFFLAYNDLDYEISQQFLGYIHPLKKCNFGIAMISLDAKGIEIRSGPTIESDREGLASNFAVIGGLGIKEIIMPNLFIGISLKYFNDVFKFNEEEDKAKSYAIDLGLLYYHHHIIGTVTLGINTQNIVGKEIGGKELPKSFKIGFAWSPRLNLLIAQDVDIPYEHNLRWRVGIEWYPKRLKKKMAIRIGSEYNKNRKNLVNSLGYSFGFGLTYQYYTIDYAYVPYGNLINTHRVSLRLKY